MANDEHDALSYALYMVESITKTGAASNVTETSIAISTTANDASDVEVYDASDAESKITAIL